MCIRDRFPGWRCPRRRHSRRRAGAPRTAHLDGRRVRRTGASTSGATPRARPARAAAAPGPEGL
eukprot:7596407-Alexandrium_andersonii.AAC.1